MSFLRVIGAEVKPGGDTEEGTSEGLRIGVGGGVIGTMRCFFLDEDLLELISAESGENGVGDLLDHLEIDLSVGGSIVNTKE